MEALNARAELYALLHRGTPGDEAFYLRECRDADSLLEFGCGHGRLMLPLARAGHRVTGIDLDEGLLNLARASFATQPTAADRATLRRGDMQTVSLAGHFARVIIPYNGLYCLESESEQVSCLANAARHLAPGGRIIFDAYAIDDFHFEADEDEDDADHDPVDSLSWRGTVWDVYESSSWERRTQRLQVHYRYQARDTSDPIYQRIDHHYLLTGQIPRVCEAAGLRILRIAGGFQGERFNQHSEHLTCVAEAA